MQKIILTCSIVLSCLFSYSQQKSGAAITGLAVDSLTRAPIEYATITFFLKGSKKALTGTTSDNTGHFVLNNIAEGNYTILVESIGYLPFSMKNVVLNKSDQLDLKEILLIKRGSTLQNVEVTSSKGLVENRIDKMVYNAEKDLTSQGGVATDILKKVPQVSVDVDGNVQLAGNSGVRFLINGKPSSAFGNSIADVLQSIPASQIKSIEVVTNPGAKYDAQGMAGIINIILKKSRVNGINGNISLSGGTRVENGSFNFNARKNNFGVNAFISGNKRLKSTTPSASDRLTNDSGIITSFNQQGSSSFNRHGYQSGVGFDWTYNQKNSFSGEISYNNFGNSGLGVINQQLIKKSSGGILLQQGTVNYLQNKFVEHNVDAGFNYKRTFTKDDQELEISFNTSNGTNHSRVSNYQTQLPQDSIFYGTNINNPANVIESEFKIDYTQPLKEKILLGVGTKLSLADIKSTSEANSLDPNSGNYIFDNGLSNNLDYKQKVYAFYSELSFPVGHLFNAKIGGRYERTEINSFYSKAQQQSNAPGYNTLVPSIFFSKELNDNETLKLSYSKRIERPDYEDLNPFINTSDPNNLSAGNPYLHPEIGHRVELGFSYNFKKAGSVMATLFYRLNKDDIQRYVAFYPTLKIGDTTYTNVSVSTRENIGTEKNAGLNIFANVNITTKLSLRSNLSFFHRHTINALNAGSTSNSFNYRINMNASYEISKTIAAEFFGNFNSPRNEVQGRYPSFTSYSMAIRKQFWNKKASLAFTATNPFAKYVNQQTTLYGPNFTVSSLRRIPFRSFGLNFTWKFGRLEFKKSQDNNGPNLNSPVD